MREAELRVGLAGGDLLVGLAAHVGGDADEDRLGRARPARPRRPGAPAASISSKLSITIKPTPALAAPSRSSASDLALPCSTIRSGAKPAFSARCSSPAGGHVAPQALLREQARARRVQGKALEANTTSKSSCPVSRAGLHERARAGAQVVLGDDVGGRAELARELDRVAARRPRGGRARSGGCRAGTTCERLVRRCAIAAGLSRARSGSAPAERASAGRARSPQRQPRAPSTPATASPTSISPRLSSCGAVSPASTSVLRRMNSTSKPLEAAEHAGTARTPRPGARGRAAATAGTRAGTSRPSRRSASAARVTPGGVGTVPCG